MDKTGNASGEETPKDKPTEDKNVTEGASELEEQPLLSENTVEVISSATNEEIKYSIEDLDKGSVAKYIEITEEADREKSDESYEQGGTGTADILEETDVVADEESVPIIKESIVIKEDIFDETVEPLTENTVLKELKEISSSENVKEEHTISDDEDDVNSSISRLTEDTIVPELHTCNTESTQETVVIVETETFKEFDDHSTESLQNVDESKNSDSNGNAEEPFDLQSQTIESHTSETHAEPQSNTELDDGHLEKSLETDGKEFVEKLKILKGNLLARHILREDSYSKIGSIDVDETVDVELETLISKPVGKTLDEELRESKECIKEESKEYTKDLTDGAIIVEFHNSEEKDNVDVSVNLDTTSKLEKESDSEDLNMSETREDVNGAVSPSLMFASCSYRWEKTIVTGSSSVVFVTINNKDIEPIQLEWRESSKCFYSEEFKIPVGTYVGHLVVDGAFYPVEDITVKHYTFEVDLYLKDDIIEDEAEKTGVSKAEEFIKQQKQTNGYESEPREQLNTRYSPARATNNNHLESRAKMEAEPEETASSIHVTSKYESLVRSQMSHSKSPLLDTDFDKEVDFTLKSEFSDGRRSPVGDDGMKQYRDGEDRDLGYSQMRVEDPHTESFNKSVVEDDVDQHSIHSGGSKASRSGHGGSPFIDDVLGNGHTRSPIYSTESPVHSRHSSAHSSARQTPTATGTSTVRPESVGSNRSANSVSKHILDDVIRDSILQDQTLEHRNEVRHGSGAVTPPPEQIGDVLNPSDRHSPIRRDYLSGSPRVSNHSSQASAQNSAQGSAQNSAASSRRQTPQRDFISDSLKSSQEKLYEEVRKLNGSQGSGPHSNSSLAGSRPQSLTSEQELSQYYENGTEVRRTPVQSDGPGSRTGSASSLPVIGSQRQTPDKRSMTPDNHIRVPAVGPVMKGPLLPGRTTPRTPISNASSRTITPVNTPVEGLEQTTVSNLRNLLSTRDQEVQELKGQFEEIKDINKKLQGDVDRLRARASPGPQIAELERKYRDVVDERERLSSEVVRLHEELIQKTEPSLNRYDPNSPTALQRKIDELNSQIQDLHEVNEAAVEEKSAVEKRVKELNAENEAVRSTHVAKLRELEDENRHLKAENQRLKESQPAYSEVTDYRYKIELQQVKEDNRSLRDRNYSLHDDNLRLKEELAELRKSVELVSSVRKHYTEDTTGTRKLDRLEKLEDKEKYQDTSYHSELGRSDYRSPGPDRTLSEERHKYTYKRSLRYDMKPEPVRMEKEFDTDRLSKTDTLRYDSYRVGPDGGSSEKSPNGLSSKYDVRPLTPERPSALGPAKKDYSLPDSLDKKYGLYERRDLLDRGRKDRNRTSSADLDFRSMPLSTYSDMTRTTPALSGRSREIYQELSDKRAANRPQVTDNALPQSCESHESDENKAESETQDQTNTNSLTSKVFVNRYIPQNKESEDQTEADAGKRLSAERIELSYAKSSPSLIHTRSHIEKEERVYDPRPAESFLDDGDMSDTPTDILVSVQPLERLSSTTWARGRNRRGSVGSDASNSSFSDIDEQLTSSVRKRSKSADGREILRRMVPSGSMKATLTKGERTLSRTLSPAPPSSGHRSVTPRPLATQHNKASLSLSSSIGSLTHGLRPFAPRSAQDLQISDVIKFSRQGGKLSQGTIKFIGHLPGRGDIYLGVELDKEDGKHDGVFEGIRYFKCKPSKGVFVAYNKVVMAWTA